LVLAEEEMKTLIVWLSLTVFGLGAFGQEGGSPTNSPLKEPRSGGLLDYDVWKGYYDEYRDTKYFVVMCMLQGEEAQQELGESKFEEFVRLRLSNSLGWIPIKPKSTAMDDYRKSPRDGNGQTWVKVYVETVSKGQYPAAYHLKLQVAVGFMNGCDPYELETIGICRRDRLESAVKDMTAEFISKFAEVFMKARGKS
jgi:hypothetical protein